MDMKGIEEGSVTEKSNDGWERDGCSVGWLTSNWMRGSPLPQHFSNTSNHTYNRSAEFSTVMEDKNIITFIQFEVVVI